MKTHIRLEINPTTLQWHTTLQVGFTAIATDPSPTKAEAKLLIPNAKKRLKDIIAMPAEEWDENL